MQICRIINVHYCTAQLMHDSTNLPLVCCPLFLYHMLALHDYNVIFVCLLFCLGSTKTGRNKDTRFYRGEPQQRPPCSPNRKIGLKYQRIWFENRHRRRNDGVAKEEWRVAQFSLFRIALNAQPNGSHQIVAGQEHEKGSIEIKRFSFYIKYTYYCKINIAKL